MAILLNLVKSNEAGRIVAPTHGAFSKVVVPIQSAKRRHTCEQDEEPVSQRSDFFS